MADFTIECFQNQYLPAGRTRMHAVITVTVSATGRRDGRPRSGPATGAGRDHHPRHSGSMRGAPGKIQAAKAATVGAIDCLPDGVRFGVTPATTRPLSAFPPAPPLAVSTPLDPPAGQGDSSRRGPAAGRP